MQIQISWLLQKPTDLDLLCLLRQGMLCLAREGLTEIGLSPLVVVSPKCFEAVLQLQFQFLCTSVIITLSLWLFSLTLSYHFFLPPLIAFKNAITIPRIFLLSKVLGVNNYLFLNLLRPKIKEKSQDYKQHKFLGVYVDSIGPSMQSDHCLHCLLLEPMSHCKLY